VSMSRRTACDLDHVFPQSADRLSSEIILTPRCQCGEQFHASEEHIGRELKCRRCGNRVLIARPTVSESHPVKPRPARAPRPHQPRKPLPRYQHLYKATAIIGIFTLIGAMFLGNRASGRGEPSPTTPSASSDITTHSVPEASAPLPEAVPTCMADSRVPANGKELMRGGRGGNGGLTIDNGSGHDAVVGLYDLGKKRIVRLVYVRGGMVGQAISIEPGKYSVRFALGEAYSVDGRHFCSSDGASQFDDSIEYGIVEREDGRRYTRSWKMTLQPVVNGNATWHAIPADLVFGDPTLH
jgi:DNA-directed RNA polymerase subunit RPC12/RpoP